MTEQTQTSTAATTAQPDDFGDRLTQRLGAERMSASELARRLGVSRQAVQHWVDGVSRPSPAVAERVRAELPGLEVVPKAVGRPRIYEVGARRRRGGAA